jgi:RimJ/RimL family protein N-acetyltransferase
VNKFEFVPITQDDFPLLHDWLNRPHVADKWDGPLSFAEVKDQYQRMLQSDYFHAYIVKMNGESIGYIQSYHAVKVGKGWWPNEKPGTWGIDQFIADKNLLGLGFGSEFVRRFCDQLLASSEVNKVITDPAPDNSAAIRAYEKAGFSQKEVIDTPDGPALLMVKMK